MKKLGEVLALAYIAFGWFFAAILTDKFVDGPVYIPWAALLFCMVLLADERLSTGAINHLFARLFTAVAFTAATYFVGRGLGYQNEHDLIVFERSGPLDWDKLDMGLCCLFAAVYAWLPATWNWFAIATEH